MSINTPINNSIYANTPIRGLEYIENKALSIAPFEITKYGLLDTDLLLDTNGSIILYLYRKQFIDTENNVIIKEPTAEQFRNINTLLDLETLNITIDDKIASINMNVKFKYNTTTETRTIERNLSGLPTDYFDITLPENFDFSAETGTDGFFCVCLVQKNIKSPNTSIPGYETKEFIFMIPSSECQELITNFDILDVNNKVININKYGSVYSSFSADTNMVGDFFGDNSNKATYTFGGNLEDKNNNYNAIPTNITYDIGKFGQGGVFTNNSSATTELIIPNVFTISFWIKPTAALSRTVANVLSLNSASSPFLTSSSSNSLGISLHVPGTVEISSIGEVLTLNEWNHIVLTCSSPIASINNQKMYKNGIIINTQMGGSGTFTFGKFNFKQFAGMLDQVRIFNRVLNNTEILSLTNELVGQSEVIQPKQNYRCYPHMLINENNITPKFYFGSKYQRNIMDVLSQSIKTKRSIYNLKDMYLVNDECINTLNKINDQLELDAMVKLSERLYIIGIIDKINVDYILEYISTPVVGTQNNEISQILKDSLLLDYNFTQEELNNLDNNLNIFKTRARIQVPTINITNDNFEFSLPKNLYDNNRSGMELKKNLLVFGTDKGFNKFSINKELLYISYFSNIKKRSIPLVLNDILIDSPLLLEASSKNSSIDYINTNNPIIFAKATTTGVSELSNNSQKVPNLVSDLDSNGIPGIISQPSVPSYVATNIFNFGTGDFTIEFDLKPLINQTNTFFTIGMLNNYANLMVSINNDDSVTLTMGRNDWAWTGDSRKTPAGSVLPNKYTHIVFQRTAGVLDIFINGTIHYTADYGWNINAQGNIFFGSYFGGGGHSNYRFNNFEVYKRAKYSGNFNSLLRYGLSDNFKTLLKDYQQRLPFTYIPLSTDLIDTDNKPVFENLNNITGFNKSDIIIKIPNTL